MKKILGFVIAVGMIAAGIAPAMASDVELSGEIRVRHEIKSGNNFQTTGASSNDTTQRTRLNAKVEVDDQTTAFISLADVRGWGENTQDGAANQDSDGVHLNEGWLKIENAFGPVSVKAGRQRLSFGKQRLLGALEWTDTGNRWDGLSFGYKNDIVNATLFFAERTNSEKDCVESILTTGLGTTTTSTACGGENTDNDLNGLYVTVSDVIPTSKLDLYVIQKTGDGEMDFNTAGIRVAGKAMNIDWDVEYAVQSGDITATTDAGAAMYVAEVGYSMPDVMGLRIGAQMFMGEGAEGNDAAWDDLYPTNHFKYGIADKEGGLSGQNVDGVAGNEGLEGFGVNISFKPTDGVSVKAEYLVFESETGDVDLGEEMNIGVKFSLTEKVKVYAYATSFDPDEQYTAAVAAVGSEEYEKVGIQLHAKF